MIKFRSSRKHLVVFLLAAETQILAQRIQAFKMSIATLMRHDIVTKKPLLP